MTVNTTWVNPAGATLDLTNGFLVTETNWDALASGLYVLGGTDGLSHTGKYQIGTTQTYSNAFNTAGLNVNMGAADDEILSLKSSDVAHGVTAQTETDTFGRLKKSSNTSGGLDIWGFSEVAGSGLRLLGVQASDDTGKTIGAGAAISFYAANKAGADIGAVGANGNLAVIINGGTTRFIFDAEGDGHADVSWTTYDTHDDLALIADIEDALLSREMATDPTGAMTERRKRLEDTGVINRDSWHLQDGRPRAMVNFTRLAMLHHGALIQVAQRFERLAEAERSLTARIEALERHPALLAA